MKHWMTILLILIPVAAQAQSQDKPVPIQPSQPSLSLWWQSDRLGQGLIEDWSIAPDSKLIRIQINGQAWLAADYVKRYAIVQKLGTTARQSNYDILLENNRQTKLAEYKYLNDKWQIEPPLLGANPFSANNGIFFGLR